MTNYCGSRFIHGYSTLTHSLFELTKKNSQWKWTQQHEVAFQALKNALTEAPVLAYFNPLLSTELHVDASPVGLCAILMQIDKDGTKRTVQYASRVLTPVEQRYSQMEHKALTVVWACEHLYIYIMGSAVTIYTDHKLLIPIFNNQLSKTTARIKQWTLCLQLYEMTLKYCSDNSKPDIKQKDDESKLKMKTYADKRHRAKEARITIGDSVLVKYDNNKHKGEPPFDPKPLLVTKQNSTMLTAKQNEKVITRNASFIKPLSKQPDEVSSDEEEDDLVPEPIAKMPPQAPAEFQPQKQAHMQPDNIAPPTPAMQQPPQRPRRQRRTLAKFKDFIINK